MNASGEPATIPNKRAAKIIYRNIKGHECTTEIVLISKLSLQRIRYIKRLHLGGIPEVVERDYVLTYSLE